MEAWYLFYSSFDSRQNTTHIYDQTLPTVPTFISIPTLQVLIWRPLHPHTDGCSLGIYIPFHQCLGPHRALPADHFYTVSFTGPGTTTGGGGAICCKPRHTCREFRSSPAVSLWGSHVPILLDGPAHILWGPPGASSAPYLFSVPVRLHSHSPHSHVTFPVSGALIEAGIPLRANLPSPAHIPTLTSPPLMGGQCYRQAHWFLPTDTYPIPTRS